MMFDGLTTKEILGFTVLGAGISTIGSLFAVVIKDYFFSRSFENWKERQSLERSYRRFKDPLILSAYELANRILEILNEYPTVFLRDEVLNSNPKNQEKNSESDPYFQKYKLISSAYRLSAFLSWIELYRQEITFLQSDHNSHTNNLDIVIGRLRSALADGHLNKAINISQWRDTLIFREELRAIGESLIESRGASRAVMGYGKYHELINQMNENSTKNWSLVVLNFFLNLNADGRDFRKKRMEYLFIELVNLIKLLTGRPIPERLGLKYKTLGGEDLELASVLSVL